MNKNHDNQGRFAEGSSGGNSKGDEKKDKPIEDLKTIKKKVKSVDSIKLTDQERQWAEEGRRARLSAQTEAEQRQARIEDEPPPARYSLQLPYKWEPK